MATKEELILIFHCYYKLETILQHPLKFIESRGNTDSLFLNPPAAEGLLLLTQGTKIETANHF